MNYELFLELGLGGAALLVLLKLLTPLVGAIAYSMRATPDAIATLAKEVSGLRVELVGVRTLIREALGRLYSQFDWTPPVVELPDELAAQQRAQELAGRPKRAQTSPGERAPAAPTVGAKLRFGRDR